MKDLETLIYRIKRGINKKSGFIKYIKNPYSLVSALEELNDLIGNDCVKSSIVDQVNYLIVSNQKNSNKKNQNSDVMINTVLAGPPGTGKTCIATSLAKIYQALGVIKPVQKPVRSNMPLSDVFKPNQNNQNDETGLVLILGLLFLIWIISLTWNFYSNYGGLLTMILVVALIFVIFAIFYYVSSNNTSTVKNNFNLPKDKKYNNAHNDEESIRIVSRVDLCGKFVGHSAPMTTKVLEESLGKVLFIDEAYDLMHGPEDSFGMEIITCLNLFLSQHPGEIVVIIAGYQDKLDKGIFTYQPGLRRRFGWQHIMDGYNTQELFDIFKYKLIKEEWALEDEKNTRLLFDKYPDAFENFAGDIDRIIFYSSLAHSNDVVNHDSHINLNTLNCSQVERGILRLLKNSVKTEEDEDVQENTMSQFINMFKPKNKPKPRKMHDSTTFPTSTAVEELATEDCYKQIKINDISPF